MIDKYHGIPYSPTQTQPIQCQLEVNQVEIHRSQ